MAPTTSRLKIRLTPELLAKLSEMAAQRGVSAQVLAEAFVASGATGVGVQPPKDRPIGRPVQNDLPPEVERSPITSGFTGVYPRGARWMARWLHEELGMFSNPEVAAIARYWFEQGRRSVARDTLVRGGIPREEAARLSRFKGGGAPVEVLADMKIEGVGDAATAGGVPVAPRRRGRPRKERPALSLAQHTAVTEAVRATSTDDDDGGGSPDTTYDEPPEDLGSRPGGEVPASPRNLRWPRKPRQLRMVDYDPPPPKPPESGSDPEA